MIGPHFRGIREDLFIPSECKKDVLQKGKPIEMLKDYCGELPRRKEGEEGKQELMKEILKTSKHEHLKDHRKKEKGGPGTDDEADGEKSGNEDTTPKAKKKKVLKKRKFSSNMISPGMFNYFFLFLYICLFIYLFL